MSGKSLDRLIYLVCIVACCVATPADAAEIWALRVVLIEIDGRAADTASEVAIIAPGQDKAEKRALRRGTVVEQGTEIVVPRRTVLVLESANGNQLRLQLGSRFKVNIVGSEGETYSLLLGQALFKVSRALNFFNVNYQSFLAIVRGTEFDMAVEPEKEIRFRLREGRLVVQREVKVKILQENTVKQLTAREVLMRGGKTQVSYRLGVEEYLKEFKTFKDAEEYFRRQLDSDEKSGEYERVQQGLDGLGHILLTVGKYWEAIQYLGRTLKAARERGDEIWEALLLEKLGAAWDDLGEHKKVIEYHDKALSLWLKYGVDPAIAVSYNNLGNAYYHLGKVRTAIECDDKALALWLKLYPGRVHPAIAASYYGLGSAYRGLGEYRTAIGYDEKALVLLREFYPDGVHPNIAASYNNLGLTYYHMGEYPTVIEYHDKALALRLKIYPDGVHPDVLQIYRELSSTNRAAGERGRAAEYAKKADEIEAKLKR